MLIVTDILLIHPPYRLFEFLTSKFISVQKSKVHYLVQTEDGEEYSIRNITKWNCHL